MGTGANLGSTITSEAKTNKQPTLFLMVGRFLYFSKLIITLGTSAIVTFLGMMVFTWPFQRVK